MALILWDKLVETEAAALLRIQREALFNSYVKRSNAILLYFYIVTGLLIINYVLCLGVFNKNNTVPPTTAIPVAPTLYAISLPAHQYMVVNKAGPRPLPS